MITLNENAKPEATAFTNTCAFIVQNANEIGTNILYVNFPAAHIKEGETHDFTFTLANINGKLCQA